MAATVWHLGPADGQLLVKTGVAGAAAKMGHRLTIAMTSWQARVRWADGEPVAVEVTVDVDSLEVQRGDGGVTGLSGPEKVLARVNALKSLSAKQFPHIRFTSEAIGEVADGYRLNGALEIHGESRGCVVDLHLRDAGDVWQMSCDVEVSQTDFGVTPYSMMFGALKVADDVTVSFAGTCAKEGR